ncbi:MAG: type IV secretory system conjugative DNA transfer family protein [Proteobacteria bacterium]|nr:type IV secretory system conjugative DNA transfer family protein [Pseudomonadota bacterium]
MKDSVHKWVLSFSITIIVLFLNLETRLAHVFYLLNTRSTGDIFLVKNAHELYFLYDLFVIGILVVCKTLKDDELIKACLRSIVVGTVLCLLVGFMIDLWILSLYTLKMKSQALFATRGVFYFVEEKWFYINLLVLILGLINFGKYLISKNTLSWSLFHYKSYLWSIFVLATFIFIVSAPTLNLYLSQSLISSLFVEFPTKIGSILNICYVVSIVSLILLLHYMRKNKKISIEWTIQFINVLGVSVVLVFCFEIMMSILPYQMLSNRGLITFGKVLHLAGSDLKESSSKFISIIVLMIFLSGYRSILKKKLFNDNLKSETSGSFGTSSWASEDDLKALNAYDPNNGIFIGKDDKERDLYLPLYNKLTLSPPGGGKTTTSSIPVLLSHTGPAFVFDIKGELWATTARYRSKVLGRKVILIDPYRITAAADFKAKKPKSLLKTYSINPFDWIPEDSSARDRMMNAFASSFIVREGKFAAHFDEHAKILIRGYIDYLMNLGPKSRNLEKLYELMSQSKEEAEETFCEMSKMNGRASAASNQINRVGMDERGSILSTSYRQIDWMGDSNIKKTLYKSNFDLREFLKGNMDIFIILPEDQVREHSRLVRMLLLLLMSMIVEAKPSELPNKKMLFLLEELGQLGYCPDVEQCIEVLRARGVVVWTVFQTLSQIEQFEKPDLFKGAPLKQIFTNDDTKTMEWIQTLGGKKTILTKTRSCNEGDTEKKMQVFGGSRTRGEGESIQETGVDLIPLNEIREMGFGEQFIFLHGTKPIRCKKVRYFENNLFWGKFDENPLEKKK